MYKKQKSQLNNLSRSLQKLYNSGQWHAMDELARKAVLNKLNRLWEKLQPYLTRRELRKILASLAFLTGFGGALHAQQFGNVQVNPFGLSKAQPNTGNSIRIVDLDGDGDLDMVGANYDYYTSTTSFFYRENTGTKENPQFGNPQNNPFGLSTYASLIHMSAVIDMDNDGDLDIVATSYGSPDPMVYFENNGTKNSPSFKTPVLDPFNFSSSDNFGLPTVVAGDIDNDGDPDVMFFSYDGASFFENTGSPASPSFALPVASAFNISMPNGTFFGAELFDLDNDGDLDLLVNQNDAGRAVYFENTGTPVAPDYAAGQNNPFGLSALNGKSLMAVSAADLDNDGDTDLLFTDFMYSYSTYGYESNFYYFENTEVLNVREVRNNNLNIYPQPCTEYFMLDLSESNDKSMAMKITGLRGESYLTAELKGNQTHKIPVADLVPGVYFVQVNGVNYKYNGKLIKN